MILDWVKHLAISSNKLIHALEQKRVLFGLFLLLNQF